MERSALLEKKDKGPFPAQPKGALPREGPLLYSKEKSLLHAVHFFASGLIHHRESEGRVRQIGLESGDLPALFPGHGQGGTSAFTVMAAPSWNTGQSARSFSSSSCSRSAAQVT